MLNRFLELYDLVMEQIQGGPFEFENMTIALIPGSFKPPHKGHWEMVMNFIDKVDKIVILISNVSSSAISSRPLSLSNLKTFGKINEYFQKAYDKTDGAASVLKDQKEILDSLSANANSLPYKDLKTGLIRISNMPVIESKEYMKFKKAIDSYIERLDNSLFTSIRKTANNIEITPEMCKEIFDIFINAYGVQNKVEVIISDEASSVRSAFEFADFKCNECKIYLTCSSKGNDQIRFSVLDHPDRNETNEMIPVAVDVKTMLSATELRENINDLKKEWFPDKLSNEDFEKIKSILN